MRILIPLVITFFLCVLIIIPYLYILRKKSEKVEKKILKAQEEGTNEPVSLHPVIDPDKCIGSGACIQACPEKDILGVSRGKGCLIEAARCVGHGACAQACPVGAITLVFGTEKRGVDIPHLTPRFETNVKGVFIAGELGGMGLIKNAMRQGNEAVDYISEDLKKTTSAPDTEYDLIIVGAGPAGLSAGLKAIDLKMNYLILDQYDAGGTVLNYPRKKIVMTTPLSLPLFKGFNKKEIPKEEMLSMWRTIISKKNLSIQNEERVAKISGTDGKFTLETADKVYKTRKVLLAVGRRGTPKKLGLTGENLGKVAYRLVDADQHKGDKILVVGGGDSAVEAALALSAQNEVVLSYRKETFSRIKTKNRENLKRALLNQTLKALTPSIVTDITQESVVLTTDNGAVTLKNDIVYIFAGGEMPSAFLNEIGIKMERMYGKVLESNT